MTPHQESFRVRAQRCARASLLVGLGGLVFSGSAQAGFDVHASVANITLTALDANNQPLGDGSFSLTGQAANGYFAWVSGATTDDAANPWQLLLSSGAQWDGSGTTLPPAGVNAGVAHADADNGFTSQIDAAGLSIHAHASGGSTRYDAAYADLGSQYYGDNLVSLAPHTTLKIDSLVNYSLQQDGQCVDTTCDAALLTAAILVFSGDNAASGNSVFKAISPIAINHIPYGSFLAQQDSQLSGSEHLFGWIFNDTDSWANYDFYVDLTGAGASVVASVPEPGTWALFGVGLLGVCGASMRCRGAAAA